MKKKKKKKKKKKMKKEKKEMMKNSRLPGLISQRAVWATSRRCQSPHGY